MVIQVLVDADNVSARRVQAVLDLIADRPDVVVTASGRAGALERVSWPPGTTLVPMSGWQRADVALAQGYRPGADPLVLVTGDGDFGLLAARHTGAVLVVSGSPSGRLRDVATVVDPATDGPGPVQAWLDAVADPRS